MTRSVPDRLAADWPPEAWQDVTVVAAVSGGPDSMALLRAMAEVRQPGPGRLLVAHFNHRLRGAESDADEAFVLEICQQLDLECHVQRAAETSEHLAEEQSRGQRYDFLTNLAARTGARYLATAHTADDQAETILHHVVRGTGLAGLAGMPRTRVLNEATVLIRPLLEVRRAELVTYLDQLGQPYRIDATNQDPAYTRNRIRHDLLPRLAEDYNPSVVEALLRLGQLAGDAQRVVSAEAETLLSRAVQFDAHGTATVDAAALADVDRHLVREMFVALWRRMGWPQQGMGFAEFDELAAHIASQWSGTRTYAGAIEARGSGEFITLAKR